MQGKSEAKQVPFAIAVVPSSPAISRIISRWGVSQKEGIIVLTNNKQQTTKSQSKTPYLDRVENGIPTDRRGDRR